MRKPGVPFADALHSSSMGLLTIVFALVGGGALVVAAKAIGQLGQANQAMMCLLADNLAASHDDQRATRAVLSASHRDNQDHLLAALSRIQGSVSYSISDAIERTASAIGAAVQTATTPVVAPLSIRDEVERVSRAAVAGDTYVDPIDDLDPTDRWIAPERTDVDLVAPGDRNPTGIPGFGFDALPFDVPANLAPNGTH